VVCLKGVEGVTFERFAVNGISRTAFAGGVSMRYPGSQIENNSKHQQFLRQLHH